MAVSEDCTLGWVFDCDASKTSDFLILVDITGKGTPKRIQDAPINK